MASDLADEPIASTSFLPPTKRILSPAHLAAYKRSETCAQILRFVDDLNESIVGRKLGSVGDGSKAGSHQTM